MTQATPASVRAGFPLERLSTIRTGGPAELFARASTEAELLELLAFAARAGKHVSVVGSGSNLLIADEGVAGLVLKLDGELAAIELEGRRLVCGAGARLPSVAARAARAGLSGIEFGVNIPGTVGGAVRMNANAYGGELQRALEWVDIVAATGKATIAPDPGLAPDPGTAPGPGLATAPFAVERRKPEQLGLSYRSSSLADGEIVIRASFALAAADRASVSRTLAELRERRHAAQPQGIRTFGSTFKNPADPRAGGRSAGLLLAEAGCAGLAVGGARFSPKHANFIENTGGATTADVLAVMALGRRRVAEQFGVELEAEVQTLGDVRMPWR